MAPRIKRSARRSLRYRGLFVLVLWQAPIGPAPRPDGSIGFMFGFGNDELIVTSCDGAQTGERRAVRYRLAAAEFEHDLGKRFELHAVAGLLGSSERERYEGGFGVAQLQRHWPQVGVGAGVAIVPLLDYFFIDTAVFPSAHVRVGNAASAHARVDLAPTTALVPQQIARAGVGWNAADRARVAGFVGVALAGGNEGTVAIATELRIPIRQGFTLDAIAHAGRGEEHAIAGVAVGARVLLR